jgi:hypothetical protein
MVRLSRSVNGAKSCDTSLLFVEVDLSALAGRSLNFILGVHTDGSHEMTGHLARASNRR